MVFSTVRGTSNGNYSWAQGTSMASPAAAGVVALMMEASGGTMDPGLVKTRLANSATDLGKPGKDEYYGHGFVNAAKAVGL
jgi:subtilisin family serine protease